MSAIWDETGSSEWAEKQAAVPTPESPREAGRETCERCGKAKAEHFNAMGEKGGPWCSMTYPSTDSFLAAAPTTEGPREVAPCVACGREMFCPDPANRPDMWACTMWGCSFRHIAPAAPRPGAPEGTDHTTSEFRARALHMLFHGYAAQETPDAEAIAQRFHEAYERLAPSFGYETRKASARPWAEVPENNRRLMTAVCAEVLAALTSEVARLTTDYNTAADNFDMMTKTWGEERERAEKAESEVARLTEENGTLRNLATEQIERLNYRLTYEVLSPPMRRGLGHQIEEWQDALAASPTTKTESA